MESSNIGCIASLNPLDDLTLDELADFLKWQRPRTGLTAEQFYNQDRAFRHGTFLRWCSERAFEGATFIVRVLSLHPLEIDSERPILTDSDCQKIRK